MVVLALLFSTIVTVNSKLLNIRHRPPGMMFLMATAGAGEAEESKGKRRGFKLDGMGNHIFTLLVTVISVSATLLAVKLSNESSSAQARLEFLRPQRQAAYATMLADVQAAYRAMGAAVQP